MFPGDSVEPVVNPMLAEDVQVVGAAFCPLVNPPEPIRLPTPDVTIVYAKSQPMPADAWTKGPVAQEVPPKAVPAKTHEELNAEINEDLIRRIYVY